MAAPLARHAHAALIARPARKPRAAGRLALCPGASCAALALRASLALRALVAAASCAVILAPFIPPARAAGTADAADAADAAALPARPAVPTLAGQASTVSVADPRSDAPEGERPSAAGDVPAFTRYDEALARWRSAADVEAWLGRHFRYDMARALQLSESQRRRQGTLPIVEPPAFFAQPSGVCVDVARFGVETLRRIDPGAQARYLMIEFDPLTLAGQTLRRHWVAMVEVGGQRYVFADSKRPGVVAGPYPDTQAFIDEYARYRGRRIVAFQERASFERQMRRAAGRTARETPMEAPAEPPSVGEGGRPAEAPQRRGAP